MPLYTNYLRAIYNYVEESNNNFYTSNIKKVKAKSILSQTKATLKEIKKSKLYRLTVLSNKLLKLFLLITKLLYRRVFLFVCLCNVTTFY